MLLKLISILFILIVPVYADTTVDGYSVDQVQTLDVVGDCPLDISSIGNARICFDETLGKLQCSENGGAYADCVGGGAGTPGGSTTQVQYNNAGAFGGSTNFTFDGTNVDTNGTMTANKFILDGFGTAPQIYPSVDTNSGLFFSGPDVLEIHTGGLNGLAINSSQNVGVATHSPSAKLHVYNTSSGHSFKVDDQANDTTPFIIDSNGNVGINSAVPTYALEIYGNTSGSMGSRINNNNTSGITALFLGENGGNQGFVQWRGTTNPTALPNTLRVGTNTSGGQLSLVSGTASSRVLIDSNGNVGIATIVPTSLLHVENTAAIDSFRVNDQANDTTPFIIDSVGNVGIGTTVLDGLFVVPSGVKIGTFGASTAPLIIKGGTIGSNLLEMQRTIGANITYGWSLSGGGLSFQDVTNAVNPVGIYADSGINHLTFGVRSQTITDTRPSRISGTSFNSGTDVNGTELQIYGSLGTGAGTPGDINFYTGNTAASSSTQQSGTIKATIKATSGNVGIGTSSPSRPLSVYASTPVVQITNPTAGGTANDGLLLTQSALDSIIENSEAGSLYLRTTATNRVRIDAGGNVGIGSLTPAAALDVTGGIRASTGTAGQAVCWKADKTLGQCTTVVGVTGDCTCS